MPTKADAPRCRDLASRRRLSRQPDRRSDRLRPRRTIRSVSAISPCTTRSTAAPSRRVNLLKQSGAENGRRIDRDPAGGLQGRARRHRQLLRHGEGRPRRLANGHVFHPGRALRARIFAVAAIAAEAAVAAAETLRTKFPSAQKEIIGATWKQLGDKERRRKAPPQNAKFLSGVQSKLRDQAVSLAGRLQMRGLDRANEEFNAFQKDMNAAADAMDAGRGHAARPKVEGCDSARAEGASVSSARRGDFPADRSSIRQRRRRERWRRGRAGRDLASLFDLELDTQKNQYEAAQTADSADSASQEMDEALRKLDELARREEQLVSQNNGQFARPAMAAGNAAPRSRGVAAPDRTAHAKRPTVANHPNGQPSGQW